MTIGIVTTEDDSQLGIRIFIVTHYGTLFFYIEALHFQQSDVRTSVASGRTHSNSATIVYCQIDIAPVINQAVQKHRVIFPNIVKQRVSTGTVIELRSSSFTFGRVCSQNNSIETGTVIGKIRILVYMDVTGKVTKIGRLGLTLATTTEESTISTRIEVECTGTRNILN